MNNDKLPRRDSQQFSNRVTFNLTGIGDSAIYGGRKNHSQVTAYDVAIGGGKAPTHPMFISTCAR